MDFLVSQMPQMTKKGKAHQVSSSFLVYHMWRQCSRLMHVQIKFTFKKTLIFVQTRLETILFRNICVLVSFWYAHRGQRPGPCLPRLCNLSQVGTLSIIVIHTKNILCGCSRFTYLIPPPTIFSYIYSLHKPTSLAVDHPWPHSVVPKGLLIQFKVAFPLALR